MAVAAANTKPTASRAPQPFVYTQRPVSTICTVRRSRGLAFAVPGGNAAATVTVHTPVRAIAPRMSHSGSSAMKP